MQNSEIQPNGMDWNVRMHACMHACRCTRVCVCAHLFVFIVSTHNLIQLFTCMLGPGRYILHCIALRCVAIHLHCIALHYLTLHYITCVQGRPRTKAIDSRNLQGSWQRRRSGAGQGQSIFGKLMGFELVGFGEQGA